MLTKERFQANCHRSIWYMHEYACLYAYGMVMAQTWCPTPDGHTGKTVTPIATGPWSSLVLPGPPPWSYDACGHPKESTGNGSCPRIASFTHTHTHTYIYIDTLYLQCVCMCSYPICSRMDTKIVIVYIHNSHVTYSIHGPFSGRTRSMP